MHQPNGCQENGVGPTVEAAVMELQNISRNSDPWRLAQEDIGIPETGVIPANQDMHTWLQCFHVSTDNNGCNLTPISCPILYNHNIIMHTIIFLCY